MSDSCGVDRGAGARPERVPNYAVTGFGFDTAGLAWERKLRAAGYRIDATPWAHVVYPREETKR